MANASGWLLTAAGSSQTAWTGQFWQTATVAGQHLDVHELGTIAPPVHIAVGSARAPAATLTLPQSVAQPDTYVFDHAGVVSPTDIEFTARVTGGGSITIKGPLRSPTANALSVHGRLTMAVEAVRAQAEVRVPQAAFGPAMSPWASSPRASGRRAWPWAWRCAESWGRACAESGGKGARGSAECICCVFVNGKSTCGRRELQSGSALLLRPGARRDAHQMMRLGLSDDAFPTSNAVCLNQ